MQVLAAVICFVDRVHYLLWRPGFREKRRSFSLPDAVHLDFRMIDSGRVFGGFRPRNDSAVGSCETFVVVADGFALGVDLSVNILEFV